jgi:pilus assembly protein CpaD
VKVVGKMRHINILTHRLPIVAALVFATGTLAGCANMARTDSIEVGAVPDDYRTRHPIVVGETEKQLMVPVGNAARELSFAEKEVVGGFLSNYRTQGSGALHVSSPSNSQNAGAAGNIANQVAQLATANGYKDRIVMSHYNAPAGQSTPPVIVSYGAMTASSGPCGKWPEDMAPTSENKNYQNFGCAYQNNLAAMVANPMDLLGPRQTGPIDAADRDKVIGDYRSKSGTWSPSINY